MQVTTGIPEPFPLSGARAVPPPLIPTPVPCQGLWPAGPRLPFPHSPSILSTSVTSGLSLGPLPSALCSFSSSSSSSPAPLASRSVPASPRRWLERRAQQGALGSVPTASSRGGWGTAPCLCLVAASRGRGWGGPNACDSAAARACAGPGLFAPCLSCKQQGGERRFSPRHRPLFGASAPPRSPHTGRPLPPLSAALLPGLPPPPASAQPKFASARRPLGSSGIVPYTNDDSGGVGGAGQPLGRAALLGRCR